MKKIKQVDFISKIMDMEIGTTYSFRIPEFDAEWFGVKCVEFPFDCGKGWIFGSYGNGAVMAIQNDEYTFEDIETYLKGYLWDDSEQMIEYAKEREKMKDGWHTICGWRVFVDDDRVIMGTSGTDLKQKPIYPYRYSKTENCWVNAAPISVAAFRTGIRRGTIQMF